MHDRVSQTPCLGPGLVGEDPLYESIVADLREGRPVAYTKLNHGFWERLVRVERLVGTFSVPDRDHAREIDARTGTPFFLEGGFVEEFLDLWNVVAPGLKAIAFGVDCSAWPGSRVIEGTPYVGVARCRDLIARVTPTALNVAGDGLEFKRAAITGRLDRFVTALRNHPLLVVGPEQIAATADFFGHRDADFIPIDHSAARGVRHEIETEIVRRVTQRGIAPVVVIQAGSLAAWLTIRLRHRFEDISIVDLGVVLNLCNIPVLAKQNWAKVYARQLARTIVAIRPDWPRSAAAYPGLPNPEQHLQLWTRLATGRDGRLAEIAERAGCERPSPDGRVTRIDPPDPGQRPLAFIENKVPDHGRVAQFVALSEHQNAYANGGPVSRLLEEAASTVIGVQDDMKVVAVANGTTGLHVLAGLEAVRRGRHLRWVSPAFTFFSVRTGPLDDCILVDCNEFGVIDRPILERLDPESYDGVIYTNIFGASANVEELARFCEDHDKSLIVDNATGLLDVVTGAGRQLPQVISCHHTKPWGFGEGGLILVEKGDEELARQLVNFGNGAPDWACRYATNGKIADYSCALILDRLERLPTWNPLYHMQLRRISALIEQNEFPLRHLWASPPNSPMSSVPLMGRSEIPPSMLANEHIVLRKYYRPLNWSRDDLKSWRRDDRVFPNAENIFRRIINFPVHPGVGALEDDVIVDVLGRLCGQSV